MRLIIISGPSGSGKTTLSKQFVNKIPNGVILNTDNYYKTGFASRLLSKIVRHYFDRNISFNINLFKRDLNFITKHCSSKYSYKYNFKNKSIKKNYKKTKNIRFIIIEGIFGKEILKKTTSNNIILIKLKTNKETCLKRVVKRDYEERGKTKKIAREDFLRAWEFFHKNKKKKKSVKYFKKFVITEKTDLKLLIKKLIKLVK